MGEAAKFLERIFGVADSGFITLVRYLPGDSSFKHPVCDRIEIPNFDQADAWVEQFRDQSPLYYNVGLQSELLPKGNRGRKEQVSACTMLWSDVDMPKEGSNKQYAPREVIESAIEAMPLSASVTVFTGGGLHVYWLLNDPVVFGSVEEAVRFETNLVRPWLSLFKEKLKSHGKYTLDAVHDVSRMLRLPGGRHKSGRDVTVAIDSDRCYAPEDFTGYLLTGPNAQDETEEIYIAVLPEGQDGTANPPIERLNALLANSREFKQSWECKRKFPSSSEYHLSLARHAADALWSDADIAALLIAFTRDKFPEKLEKCFKKDPRFGSYLARIISKARGAAVRDHALRTLNGACTDDDVPTEANAVGAVVDEAEPDDDPHARQREYDKKMLSDTLKVPVARWIQVGLETPIYTLVLEGGKQIKIGGESAVVTDSKKMIERIFSESHRVVPPIKKGLWPGVLAALCRIVEVVESPELKSSEMALFGIRSYIQAQSCAKTPEGISHAFSQGGAVLHEQQLWVCVQTVTMWLQIHGGTKWTNGDFINAIRQLGFDRKSAKYRNVNGQSSTKSYWVGPAQSFDDILASCKDIYRELAERDDPL